jgi:hypothetical protein
MREDSMTVTFGATCRSLIIPPLFNVMGSTVKVTTIEIPNVTFTFGRPIPPTKKDANILPTSITVSNVRRAYHGSIDWSRHSSGNNVLLVGNVYKVDDPSKLAIELAPHNPNPPAALGQIWLEAGPDSYDIGRITRFPIDLWSSLGDNIAATTDYWASLPSCDTITGAQKQAVADALLNQNQFRSVLQP